MVSHTEEHGLRTFKKWVRRKIFGPKRDEITGDWRRLHNKELYNVFSSPNVIRVIKSRRMRRAGHVAWVERGGVSTGFWRKSLWQGDHFQDLRVDGRTILKWIFKKWDGGVNCIDLAAGLDRWWALVIAVRNLRFPWNAGNFYTIWEPVSSSRRKLLRGVIIIILSLSSSSAAAAFPLSRL